jgi:hypothetical protein
MGVFGLNMRFSPLFYCHHPMFESLRIELTSKSLGPLRIRYGPRIAWWDCLLKVSIWTPRLIQVAMKLNIDDVQDCLLGFLHTGLPKISIKKRDRPGEIERSRVWQVGLPAWVMVVQSDWK